MPHWKLFLAGITLIIAILACNTQVNIGATPETASLSCEPTIFTLRGEVDYNWHMTLEEGTPYAINIRTNPETNTYQLTSTFVRSDALQDAVLIPAEYTFSEDDKSATTVFTAPAGIVDIVVYSLIGEDGNDLGEHIITLCPLD